jgi:hypothetical protein
MFMRRRKQMTTELKPLESIRHRSHGWKRQDHFRFFVGDARAPLLLAELPAALPIYPLAFVRRPGGGYQLVAVQGLHDGENLYVTKSGHWVAPYVPAHYRGYPFALPDAVVEGERRGVLCFDHASGLYREEPNPAEGEERFFDDSGNRQPLVEGVLSFLSRTSANRRLTQGAVDAVAAEGLLVPWALVSDNPDPTRPLQQGLHRIDEKALNALGGKSLEVLRKANALAVAYAQIFSTARVDVLRRLYDATVPRNAIENLDLDALFGTGRTDTLQFNWDSD